MLQKEASTPFTIHSKKRLPSFYKLLYHLLLFERKVVILSSYLIRLMIRSPATAPFDATHGSLALKAYQQNLYLKYYY